jgi:hypothetical protein
MGVGLRTGCHGSVARAARRTAVALAVALAGLVVCSTPALALSQRGHIFSFSFDNAAPGALSNVAVNEAAHVAYVVNHAAKVVEPFLINAESKTAEAQASIPVVSPEAIAVDNSRSEEDPSRHDLYVSSTTGSAEAPKGAIFKFENGTQIAKITKFLTLEGEVQTLGRISGLAVGSRGTLWVAGEVEGLPVIDRVSDAPPKAGVAKLVAPPGETGIAFLAPGLAVDSAELLFYVDHTEEETSEELEHEEEEKTKRAPCTTRLCQTAKFSIGTEGIESLAEELLAGNTTSVAVNDFGEGTFANDIFLDNVTGVTELSSGGSLVQHFGGSEGAFAGLQEGRGIAVEAAAGEAAAGYVFVADAKTGQVDVFVPAPAGTPTVDTLSVADVTAQSAELKAAIDPSGAKTEYRFRYSTTTPVSCASVSLTPCETQAGEIPAGFGDQPVSTSITGLQPGTEYHYQVLVSNDHGSETSLELTFTTSAQVPSELVLSDGRKWELVSPPDKRGAAIEPMRQFGADIQAAADGNAITYVADAPIEADPEGNRILEPSQVLSTRGGQTGWNSKDIATPDETSRGVEGFNPEYALFSTDLSLSLVLPRTGTEFNGRLAEPALSPALVPGEALEKTPYLRSDVPLPAEPNAQNVSIYNYSQTNRERMGKPEGAPGYLALVNHLDDNTGKPFGKEIQKVDDATPDLTHVIFESHVPLTTAHESAGLYEWSEGTIPTGELQLISVLPNGSPAAQSLAPRLGSVEEGNLTRNAISNNGTHVFWSAGSPGLNGVLYMRDTTKQQTVELSAVQEAPSGGLTERALPEYQTATPDGSRVLFTDQQRLLKVSGASQEKADLYECEMEEVLVKVGESEEEQDRCHLSDRTPAFQGHSAEVLGEVMGATESDLSRVYFVANGVLSDNENARSEHAQQGNCAPKSVAPPLGAECNLYVSEVVPSNPGHFTTHFIARLASEDLPDWEGSHSDLGEVTSRVSPKGKYVAFMSKRSLTGYDNTDVSSGQEDEEVYLYNAETEGLVCASCNPTGARPTGVLDTTESSEGDGLLMDNRAIWQSGVLGVDHWLAGAVPGWTPLNVDASIYQSRYLSDSGRLFFDSSDALVPQDINGKMDVYEYEPAQIGSCTNASATFSSKQDGCIALISSGTSSRESAFLDASEEGGDVFFLSSATLSPLDTDTAFDVYDAHECTETSKCFEPSAPRSASCNSEESCKQGASPTPSFNAPTSTASSGNGNVVATQLALGVKTTTKPPTRAQLLAKALKVCRKKGNRHKRATCEKQARKKYGAKSAKSSVRRHVQQRSSR